MKIAVVAITRHGVALGGRVVAALPGAKLYAPAKFGAEAQAAAGAASCYDGKSGDLVATLFNEVDAIVAIVSVGTLVRWIAPHLKSKDSDPAVVVIDESGKFVIPVLSGHVGGANELAARLAQALAATAVLTTASDCRATVAADILGRELGWRVEADHDVLVRVSAALVNDEPVALVQEAGSRDWWTGHAGGRSGPLPANVTLFDALEDVDPERYAAALLISTRALPASYVGRCIIYRPPTQISLGLGCDRGTPAATIAQAIDEALLACEARAADIAAVASIDIKNDEMGLLQLAAERGWSLHFYSAEELAAVDVPHPSETVRKHTGTPSVSEAAALLGGGAGAELLIEKHRLRGADGRNATVSIARINA